LPAPAYKLGDIVATREAYGTALAALGAIDRRVVALDSDVKNSTFSERFEKVYPDRFYQMFIAEQVMVGAAMGLAARGAHRVPVELRVLPRARGRFRAHGRHLEPQHQTGRVRTPACPIGEDGPSQMALEDLAMFRGVPNCTVFYPSDAMSAERLMALAADTHGPVYIRTTRPKDAGHLRGVRIIRRRRIERRSARAPVMPVTVVAAGVTLFEALKAHDVLAAEGIAIRVIDLYSVQPVDRAGLIAAGRATHGRIITVEDHYAHGGIGDAVSEAVWDQGFKVQRLAVREIPRSGPPDVLIDKYGISGRAIVEAVRALITT
jgi:transketolase